MARVSEQQRSARDPTNPDSFPAPPSAQRISEHARNRQVMFLTGRFAIEQAVLASQSKQWTPREVQQLAVSFIEMLAMPELIASPHEADS